MTAPFTATVWQIGAEAGCVGDGGRAAAVLGGDEDGEQGATPVTGTLLEIYVKPGEQVAPGQVLAAVRP